jgi:molecular chaperone IbpA
MRTVNLDPFWRTSIGFDRLFDLMNQNLRLEPEDNYPPFNIVRTDENRYRISLTVDQNVLIVTGDAGATADAGDYLHRGIAARSFERRFNLADYVQVKSASLGQGLLTIELERELPEAMKPRRIAIQTGGALGADDKVRSLEHSRAA